MRGTCFQWALGFSESGKLLRGSVVNRQRSWGRRYTGILVGHGSESLTFARCTGRFDE